MLERVEQRHQDARTGRPNRVAKRNRASVHIHELLVHAQRAHVRDRLYGESLVHLDELIVADLFPFLLHQVVHRGNGSEKEILRLGSAHCIRRDERVDLESMRLGVFQ